MSNKFWNDLDRMQKRPAPPWAAELVANECHRAKIAFVRHPYPNTFGVCFPTLREIFIAANTDDETPEAIMVVLHEIAHALGGADREIVGGKETGHGPLFWGIAVRLYEKYGVLEYAAENERYHSGQKACRLALGVPTLPRRLRHPPATRPTTPLYTVNPAARYTPFA